MLDLKYWEAQLNGEMKELLKTARIGDYFNSLNSYINLLDSIDNRQCIYIEFMECFQKCLEIEIRICIEMKVADRLFKYYPESVEICKFYARSLFVESEILKSVQIYEKAVYLTETSDDKIKLMIEMENARSHLFDQWHFPMLNDKHRNCQFGLAIERHLQKMTNEFINVVDLGCGTGILSTMIARELKKKFKRHQYCVSAIDSNPVMINVAKQVFDKNNVIVDSYCMHSSDFNTDWPIDLIVSETLDCALFGEKFISSLIDLYDRLGSKTNFYVLPCKATFYLSLCECQAIENQHFSEKSNYVLLSNECYLNWPLDSKDGLNDPYDSIQLNETTYSLLSEPTEAFTIDFNDIEFLKNIVLKNNFQRSVALKAKNCGRASCVVGWFKLDLGNGITIETSPGQKMCWPQAIFPFYPPTNLEIGENLEFNICINDEKLYVFPTNLAPVDCKKIRIQSPIDFSTLNNHQIRDYFYSSIDHSGTKDVIDLSDLLIQQKQDYDFQYLSVKPHILQIVQNSCSSNDLNLQMDKNPAILHWPFNSFGSIDEMQIEVLINFVKKFGNANLNLIPFDFKLCGMLIQSDQLTMRSSLVSSDLQIYNGVDISPMQNYYIRNVHELDLQKLDHEPISEISTLLTCSFKDIASDIIKYDSILKNKVKLKIIKPNSHCNAFVYWIELSTGDNGPKFSFQQLPMCTSAFIFKSGMEIKESTELRVSMYNYQFNFDFPEFEQ